MPQFSPAIAEEWTDSARTARRRSGLAGALIGLGLAAIPVAGLWGFTVDDALVSARVAAHIAAGLGHRFNADGPIVDAVTPLGWAHLLAPFSRAGPLAGLAVAQVLGAVAWLAAAAWLGREVALGGRCRRRFLPLLLLVCCAPLGAWAVAGQETGVVTALATAALSRSRLAPLAAGLAAAWRPELLPWASVLAVGTALAERRSPAWIVTAGAAAIGPAVFTGCVRLAAFGHAWPLAVLAKPADLDHGLRYALAALLWTGPPALVIALWTLRRVERRVLVIVLAAAAHALALVLAGGDWMPLFRLSVPVLPGLILAGSALAEVAPLWATLARTALAVLPCAVLAFTPGSAVQGARAVGAHRRALIEAAREPLRGAERVAALDVGWVGAATTAHVVDLAGITDPQIAAFAGGHTSKRIPPGLLEARRVDALVLLLAPNEPLRSPWFTSRLDPRLAVQRTVAAELADSRFEPAALISLGGTCQSYVVLRTRVDH